MAQTAPRPPFAAVAVEAGSFVDWPAILAGAVLAAALSFVLLTFGSAIGLSAASAEPGEGVSLRWITIASGIWFVWVAISSFAAGGYLAGRLRRPVEAASVDEVETRDGAHGVLVWATAALFGAVLAATGVSGLVGTVGAAAGTVDPGRDRGGRRQRRLPGAIACCAAARARPAAPRSRRRRSPPCSPADSRDGEFSAEDRDYLAGVIAERTGQTPEEAAAAVDTARAEAQELYDTALGPPSRPEPPARSPPSWWRRR